jgi:Protein of unknown function (DUF4230)
MKNIFLILSSLIAGAVLFFFGYRYLQTAEHDKYIQTTTSTIITQLQNTSKLTTAKMTVSKIIEAKKDFTDLLPGFGLETVIRKALFDDALLMTVEGVVNAGVDLSKIATGDVIVATSGDNTIVTITLPPSEIFDVYLTENTKPFERSLGILSKGDVALETKMRNSAIDSIRQEALSGTILQTATTNAQTTLRDLINKLGNNFVVEYK